MGLVLASASPRRKQLLSLLGLEFKIVTGDVDESIDNNLPIEDEIKHLSLKKAKAVADRTAQGDIIIAADTAVVLGNKVFGKPKNKSEAVAMLKTLSGKTHKVITGVTVFRGDRADTRAAVTDVTFRSLGDCEIETYADTGDPLDKAGAYALQGISSVFVSGIRGDHFNVYGLPLSMLADMLRGFGVKILGE